MRYGTIPIVYKTGGLTDTVSDVREQEDGTGFQFTPYSADAFLEAIDAMLTMWRNPKQRQAIVLTWHGTRFIVGKFRTRVHRLVSNFAWLVRSQRKLKAIVLKAIGYNLAGPITAPDAFN